MDRFRLIDDGINVVAASRQLDAHPELWNQRTERRDAPGSPHGEMSDIWVRYRDPRELTSTEAFRDRHFAVFYPAWHVLTELHPIVWRVMEKVRPVYLGGILITRIPPGSAIHRHNDKGSWHAEAMDTKVYIPLRANPECINECDGELRVIREGEAVSFNNLIDHSVVNRGKPNESR